jgi:biopolymer transport protein ExbD
MAGVDVGSSGGQKRATNSDINMIPFIDLLMCTIAFLLITAVWVTNSRIPVDAQVPGQQTCGEDCKPQVERVLHLTVTDNDFSLVWKREGTVLSEVHVPKNAVMVGDAEKVVSYPDLSKAIEKDWGQFHEHFDQNDKHRDTVVVHTDNRTPFKELVAVLDAVNNTKRDLRSTDGRVARVAAFNPTFSVR